MSKTGFVWRALAALILVILLIGGGMAVYYAGWSQGYGVSQPTVEGGESVMPPYLHRGFAPYGRPMAFLFGAGMLFKCLLGLIFFAVACKLIRFIVWGAAFGPMMCGPWPKHFHRGHWRRAARRHHRHWMHGPPMPPWFCDWDEADEEDADEDTDKAEA